LDNDPREDRLMYTDPTTGEKSHLGLKFRCSFNLISFHIFGKLGDSIPEAVWRTNHGYDPLIVHAETSQPTPTSGEIDFKYHFFIFLIQFL
jgi:hypothetical protein